MRLRLNYMINYGDLTILEQPKWLLHHSKRVLSCCILPADHPNMIKSSHCLHKQYTGRVLFKYYVVTLGGRGYSKDY